MSLPPNTDPFKYYVGRRLFESDTHEAAIINQKIVEHYTRIDEKGNFVSPPSTDDELHEFIFIAYGLRIPRKVVTVGHKSPFDFLADCYFQRVQSVLGFANRNGSKALALNTPMLTTAGWKTMIDVAVGDYVYAPDGLPTRVTSVSDVFIGNDCFKLRIGKETIVADAEHRWVVTRVKETNAKIMTTREIYEVLQNPPKIGYKHIFKIKPSSPLEFPTMPNLPVPPYVLGYYLGNGTRGVNIIHTWDDEVIRKLDSLWDISDQRDKQAGRVALRKLRQALQSANMPATERKSVKTVPWQYLYGSISQRLELLHGLMDSDGSTSRDRARCTYTSTDRPLAEAVHWLLCSLGATPILRELGPGKYGDVICKDVFHIEFHPRPEWSPFWLTRKAEKVTYAFKHTDFKIISVEPCQSVPVKCISVDHASHQYLCGRLLIPTHNTMSVAILNHLDMIFKHRCEIASAGAVKDQAEKCYRYFQEFNELPWFKIVADQFGRKVGVGLIESSIQSRTIFNNGSRLEIITGTEKGFRGPHPNKSRIDEIDEIEWDVFQTGLSMAQSSDEIRGQNVFTSTRQKSDGTMQRLLDEAADKGVKVYEWNIWETLQKCERRCFNDPVHGTCPIYTFCQGKAHECDGFYRIDDFIDKVRTIDRDKFETEWLNLKPQRFRQVYHNFNEARHVLDADRLYKMTGTRIPSDSWFRIGAIDFGSSPGHPFVFLIFFRLPSGEWLAYHEYYAEQRLLRDHADAIRNSPFYYSGMPIYADHDAQDRIELANYGVRTHAALKGPNSIAVGIDKIGEYLKGYPPEEKPMFYIWNNCANLIYEFNNYQWPIRPDGKPDKSGRPLPINDHGPDCVRYALYTYYRKGSAHYRSRRMSGV